MRYSVWVPAVTMMLVSLISYIDRNTLAILAPTIQDAAGMNNTEYSFVITAFSIAYMVGNPVWGWILDRFGLRVGMTSAVAFWTMASVAHAYADSFWTFAIARAALGFGEGATFPGGLRAVMQSLPAHQRARGVALAYSGGSAGAIVAPLIVTPIAIRWGWQSAFLFTGLIGIAWLALWQAVALRNDMRHEVASHGADLADGPRISQPSAWAFMLVYALGGLPLAFIMYLSAKFLTTSFGMSQADLGNVLWIPPFGWEVGYFFWGWVSDRAHRGRNHLDVERRLFVILALLSLPLIVVPHLQSKSLVMFMLFFAMAVAAGFIIVAISYATNVYSIRYSGTISGLGAGAWGAGVALAMPVFGNLFDHQMVPTAFVLAAIVPTMGCTLWWILTRAQQPREADL
jgi:ACS family hexuronate transporter-like MFS transporter